MPRRVRSFVQGAFLLVAAVAVGVALAAQWHRVGPHLHQLGIPLLLGAFAAVLAGLGCSLLGWRAVLRDLGSELAVRDAARVFFVGQLGKYLPGSVWPVMAQMEMGRRRGVPAARMAVATLTSIGLAVAASLLIGTACLPALVGRSAGGYLWVLACLPVIAVGLYPPVVNRLFRLGLRLLRRPDHDVELSWRGIRAGFAWFAAQWLLNGVQAWLIAVDLHAPAGRAFPVAVGAFALASAAGLLFIVAPAGAGVRDVAFVVALTPLLPAAAGTAAALVSRLVMTTADVLAALVALAAVRRGLQSGREADDTLIGTH